MRVRLVGLVFSSIFAMTTSSDKAGGTVPNEDTEWGRALEKEELVDAAACSADGKEADIEDVNVAIVGAGLTGLSLAIALNRRDIDCKVFERAPYLRSVSQGILGIQPNGLAALEKIDPRIPDLVRDAGCERDVTVFTTIDEDGTTTDASKQTGQDHRGRYGRTSVGLTWHGMQQVLASLVPKNIVETGRSLRHFEEDDNGVRLYFENGSVVRAKLVLACDGIFSAARRQMFPKDSPIFFGQLNWATIIDTNKLPANVHPPNAVHYFQYNGEPRWMSMLNDGGSGQTFWQFRVADPQKAIALSGNKGRGGLGLPGVKKALLPLAAKSSPLVASAIERIPEEQIFERSIVGRYPAETWISTGGKLALVGDAAHAMHPNIGQGANSSFESAATLVDAIVEEADFESALTSYERRRKPRADLVQVFSNMMGVLQATGATPLERSQIEEMMHWIRLNNPESNPPVQVVEELMKFDPCEHPGVSSLW